MAFGLHVPVQADIADIVKYDARAGRLFKYDYDPDTREKAQTDITTPPPRFAIDFGTLQVGYIKYSATGPDYKTVPMEQEVPSLPDDRDEKNKPTYRAGFKVQLYGQVIDGLREWSSTANCVTETVEDLYYKFRSLPEAVAGKIPIIELTRVVPLNHGKGVRASTNYAPAFAVVGWTDRVAAMGERTVPPPTASAVPLPVTLPPEPTQPAAAVQHDNSLNDEIPF